jgi:hypothetical protein
MPDASGPPYGRDDFILAIEAPPPGDAKFRRSATYP